MQTHFLFDVLDGYKPFEQMAQESQNSGAVIAASGMAGAQKAHAACALAARTGRPLLFLCDSERSATQTMEDVSALLGGGVCLLPAREITFYQDVAASREVAYRRIEAMRRALSGEARAIVAPVDAMLHRMMPREAFNRNTISLRVGDVTPIDLLIERLLAAGYTREYMVEGKGQFSVRGGIIDVYPADALSAVRIEFFDDEPRLFLVFRYDEQRIVPRDRPHNFGEIEFIHDHARIAPVAAQRFDHDLVERRLHRHHTVTEQIVHTRRDLIAGVLDIRIAVLLFHARNFKEMQLLYVARDRRLRNGVIALCKLCTQLLLRLDLAGRNNIQDRILSAVPHTFTCSIYSA